MPLKKQTKAEKQAMAKRFTVTAKAIAKELIFLRRKK